MCVMRVARGGGAVFCSLVGGRAGSGGACGLRSAGLWWDSGGFWKLGGFADSSVSRAGSHLSPEGSDMKREC